MNINRETFFTYIRRAPFGGRLTQQQVDGVSAILGAWAAFGDDDSRKLANILAQVFHETGGRMVPVREAFASTDAEAINRLDKAWGEGRLKGVSKPYWRDGWFGRGQIQITHKENYERVGRAIGVDLVKDPSAALDLTIGARIAVVGMLKGLFTGKSLSDYFNATTDDPINARRIVNGTDKAKLIAGYHKNFLDALKAAKVTKPVPPDVSEKEAEPDGKPLTKDPTIWNGVAAAAGGILTGVFGAMNNPWAFAAFAVVVLAVAFIIWKRADIRYKFGA